MYKSIRAKRNIYMNYYIPPPSTFKCKVNSKDFKLCALATYQLSDCNSSIYKIALHVCTCGKHAKNLYLCNWAKYGREAATNMQPNKKNYWQHCIKFTPKTSQTLTKENIHSLCKKVFSYNFEEREKVDIQYSLVLKITTCSLPSIEAGQKEKMISW